MEEKISLKVIDVVEKLYNKTDRIPVSSITTYGGGELPDVFRFVSSDAQSKFGDMVGKQIRELAVSSHKHGFRRGFGTGLIVAGAGIILGVVGLSAIDNYRTRKKESKSDI